MLPNDSESRVVCFWVFPFSRLVNQFWFSYNLWAGRVLQQHCFCCMTARFQGRFFVSLITQSFCFGQRLSRLFKFSFFFLFSVNWLQQEQDQTIPRKRLLRCSDGEQHLQPVMFLLPRKHNVLTSFFREWVACPTHAGNYFRKESFLLSSR